MSATSKYAIRSRWSLGSAAACALLAAAVACGDRSPEAATAPAACPELAVRVGSGAASPMDPEAADRRRSLIVVLADTLRRDRLGAYGGPAHTPAFDAFARENLLFEAATTQAPWTKPSIATLFTGLYPSQHGVVSHPRLRGQASSDTPLESDVLGSDLVTLAEELSAAGYATAAFVSNPWLQSRLGFAQGFDVYNDSFAANNTPGRVVTRAGLDWLASRAGDERPFFLYLHYMDAHAPYPLVSDAALEGRRESIGADRRPVTARARQSIAKWARGARGGMLVKRGLPPNRALIELVYDQGVEGFDRALAQLLAGLDEEPAARDAAIVVTADHGEALFARGWGSHGHGLFQDEISVPLAMRLPGVTAREPVSCVLGLIDLRRTLCDYLGLECAAAGQGRSLLADTPPPAAGVVLSEGVIDRPTHRSARDARYKLIYEPGGRSAEGAVPARDVWSLYDLIEDPDEVHDLLADDRSPEIEAVFARLQTALTNGIADLGRSAPQVTPLDAHTRERLEALGYVNDED